MTVRVLGLDHVQVLMPAGEDAETAARNFYGRVLGLREMPNPAELVARGGLWFMSGTAALHLGVDPAFEPARRSHPAFVVPDVESARTTLELAGARVTGDDSVLPVARLYVDDPFGNRIELIDAADAGFTEPTRGRVGPPRG